MILFFLFAFVLGALSGDSDFVLDPKIIEAINLDPGSTWTAGFNSIFAGKSLYDILPMVQHKNIDQKIPSTKESSIADSLPTVFDTYTKWPQCKIAVKNQGECGAAWPFTVAEVMSDRFCAAGVKVDLSPQLLISCDSHCYGCEGCYTEEDWRYLETEGLTTESCFPYNSSSGWVPRCPPKKCVDKEPWKTYKVKPGSEVHYKTVNDAMTDMFAHGSFQAMFTVYQDFFMYKSGVYQHRSGPQVGAHLVKIEGWGVSGGVKYW